MEKKKIIVALDYPHVEAAMQFVDRVSPEDCRLKIGNILFTQQGPAIVRKLVDRGFDVFLDLKYHDIPNTVLGAVQAAADLGVWMCNFHCLSGRPVLQAVGKWMQQQKKRPLCIGVTVLTSLNGENLAETGITSGVDQSVKNLAQLAFDCGIDGVVCSAHEVAVLKAAVSPTLITVTPGIRLTADTQDQQRVMTPQAAIQAGSDHLVMGRAITQAQDPVAVLKGICLE
jgi:orotidine-5'-phosphate decarboxylase